MSQCSSSCDSFLKFQLDREASFPMTRFLLVWTHRVPLESNMDWELPQTQLKVLHYLCITYGSAKGMRQTNDAGTKPHGRLSAYYPLSLETQANNTILYHQAELFIFFFLCSEVTMDCGDVDIHLGEWSTHKKFHNMVVMTGGSTIKAECSSGLETFLEENTFHINFQQIAKLFRQDRKLDSHLQSQ